jgi:hypothetical protein
MELALDAPPYLRHWALAFFFKKLDCPLKATFKIDLGLPIENFLGQTDIGSARLGIVLREWPIFKCRPTVTKIYNLLRKLTNSHFNRIPQINRLGVIAV